MLTRTRPAALLAVLGLSAVLAAGCGSSGSSGGGTGATGGQTSFDPHHVPTSAVVSSTAYYNTLVEILQTAHLTKSQAQSAAKCVQKGLEAAGFKTQGQSEGGANGHKAAGILEQCATQAEIK